MGRLFGTDGARGVANTELTCEMAMQIGRAAAAVLTKHLTHVPKLLVGKDTRISCDMLECAISAGVCSVGADVVNLGVIPTPAVAYLVKKYGADAGVMISASHNPAEFNGIKLFSGEGYKLPDAIEEEIEALILDTPEKIKLVTGDSIGRMLKYPSAVSDYIRYLSGAVNCELSGLRVAIDCANGSASVTAKKLFEGLGAKCYMLNCTPDGTNINLHCGSTHMDELVEFVRSRHCDVGLAFDGDADRCLAVDETGAIVDGDQLIAILALDLKARKLLKEDTAVVTVMSNLGFFKFAQQAGVNTYKTKVGDRYVLEEMLKSGYNLGGEQSGHIILLDHATTGDGQLSGGMLLSVMKRTGKPLSALAGQMKRYPQVMVNVTAPDRAKAALPEDEAVNACIAGYEKQLGEEGRILVRASGTEPLIRVMIEGKDEAIIMRMAKDIARTIEERLCK